MNYSKTASEILKYVKKDPFDHEPQENYFDLCRAWYKEWEDVSVKAPLQLHHFTGARNKQGRYTEFNHPAQLHNRNDLRQKISKTAKSHLTSVSAYGILYAKQKTEGYLWNYSFH